MSGSEGRWVRGGYAGKKLFTAGNQSPSLPPFKSLLSLSRNFLSCPWKIGVITEK